MPNTTKIMLEGVSPTLDGLYECDLARFTNRELHTIKVLTGIRANEFSDALKARDNDLIVAFTVIALQRAGLDVDPDEVWNADVGTISFEDLEAAKGDAGPPVARLVEPPAESEPSGTSSDPDSASHQSLPRPIGLLG